MKQFPFSFYGLGNNGNNNKQQISDNQLPKMNETYNYVGGNFFIIQITAINIGVVVITNK